MSTNPRSRPECPAAALGWRIEEAELSAFPSLRQAVIGGWVLRFSEGGPRRAANSANPLHRGCDDGEGFIDTVEALYRRRRLVPLFRVPSLLSPTLDRRLTARGYTREGESCVMWGAVAGTAATRDPAVRLSPAPGRRWLAAMADLQGHTPTQAAVYRRIVRAIAVPARFALLALDGTPAALAYAALQGGLLVYESVITDRARRRQGLARRVLGTLAAWGHDNGAEVACLAVEATNAPARALYDGFGLIAEASRYHYRRAPAS